MQQQEVEKKPNLFANKGDLKQALSSSNFILLLLKEVAPEIVGSLPLQINKLLEEFSNVFPKELPKELPPIRGIKH